MDVLNELAESNPCQGRRHFPLCLHYLVSNSRFCDCCYLCYADVCDVSQHRHSLQGQQHPSSAVEARVQVGAVEAGNLLAGSVPHDDLAIVAPPRDHFRLQGVALEAEHLIRGLQNQLGVDWISEIPNEHCVGGWSAAQGVHALIEGLRVGACHRHHTLQWHNDKLLPLYTRAFMTGKKPVRSSNAGCP